MTCYVYNSEHPKRRKRKTRCLNMDKFLQKTVPGTSVADNLVPAPTALDNSCSGNSDKVDNSELGERINTKKRRRTVRRYDDKFLRFGFVCTIRRAATAMRCTLDGSVKCIMVQCQCYCTQYIIIVQLTLYLANCILLLIFATIAEYCLISKHNSSLTVMIIITL